LAELVECKQRGSEFSNLSSNSDSRIYRPDALYNCQARQGDISGL